MIIIPKLSELYSSILADLEGSYGDSIPSFGKNFLRALAGVQAAKLNVYYRAIALTQKNIWVDTADSEDSGGTLERFGREKLNRDRFPALAGEYSVSVNGDVGSVIPASTTFKSDDSSLNSGFLFVLDSDYTLVSVNDTIILRALESGLESKLIVTDTLTATSPIPNVSKSVTVISEIVQALGEETIEEYRSKITDAFRLESQGGAASDYILWSFDAQGVKDVYPYARTGFSNEINVFIEANIADSSDGKGTPTSLILQEVDEVIEFDPDVTLPDTSRGRRPLGVFEVHVEPVTIKNIEIEVNGFIGLTTDIETNIFNALEDDISEVRPFIAGADVLGDKNDILDTNLIISTILKANPGSVFGDVVLKVDSVDVSTFTFINGDIPYLDTVNYL